MCQNKFHVFVAKYGREFVLVPILFLIKWQEFIPYLQSLESALSLLNLSRNLSQHRTVLEKTSDLH